MPFADLPTQASAILDVTRYADTLLSLHRLSLVRTHATPRTHVAWVLLLFSDSHRLSEQRERIHRRKPFNERKRVHHLKPFQSVASAVREPLYPNTFATQQPCNTTASQHPQAVFPQTAKRLGVEKPHHDVSAYRTEKPSDKEDRPAREIPAQSHISLYHNPTT